MVNKYDITEMLNEYCFKHIWNEVHSNYRSNVRPTLDNEGRSALGSVQLDLTYVTLPTNKDPYFIYSFNYHETFGILHIERDKWISFKELNNTYRLNIELYTNEGRVLPKGKAYLYIKEYENVITLAVDKGAMTKCKVYGKTDLLYIRYYYDPDRPGVATVHDTKSDGYQGLRNILFNANQNNTTHRVICYVNGEYHTSTRALDVMKPGDEIDITIDEDILYEVQVAMDEHSYAYYSDTDKLHKEILHIPKELNPDNWIITHDTCSIFSLKNGYGRYMHYVADKSMGQLTHNDLTIATHVVDAHKDYLSTATMDLVIKVRRHSKGKKLIRNSAYIDVLYLNHSDDEILKMLTNQLDSSLYFWTAKYLEDHPYIKMMYNVPYQIKTNKFDKFINTLGYYHVASIICNRVQTFTVSPSQMDIYTIRKPYIWQDERIYPMVYKNGLKILDKFVHYDNYNDTIQIKFNSEANVSIGDKLTVVMYPYIPNRVFHKKISDTDNKVVIPKGLYTLQIEKDYTGNVYSINGYYSKVNTAYMRLESDPGNIGILDYTESTSFEFGSKYNDRNVILSYDDALRIYTKDLADDILDGKNFVIPLVNEISGYSFPVPLDRVLESDVFFNGKKLVKGIDYKIGKIMDFENTGVAHHQIVVTNMSYGNDHGDNVVEVILHPVVCDYETDGWIIDNKITSKKAIYSFFNGLSTLYIGGMLETDATIESSSTISVPDNKYRQGELYTLGTSIPKVVYELLYPNLSAKDDDTIESICKYWYHTTNPEPDIGNVILTKSHRVYSSYLNYLIMGVLHGYLDLIYDPDKKRIISQLIKYNDYKQFDIIFSNPKLDRRFIDIYPIYKKVGVGDDTKAKLIRVIVETVLAKEEITSGVVMDNLVI